MGLVCQFILGSVLTRRMLSVCDVRCQGRSGWHGSGNPRSRGRCHDYSICCRGRAHCHVRLARPVSNSVPVRGRSLVGFSLVSFVSLLNTMGLICLFILRSVLTRRMLS